MIDRSNLVGGLIREAQRHALRGSAYGARAFSARIEDIYPATGGFGFGYFGECPGEPGCPGDVPEHQWPTLPVILPPGREPFFSPELLERGGPGYQDSPWYQDLFNFIKNTFSIGGGLPPIRGNVFQPNVGRRGASTVGGGCAFYEKTTLAGCQIDPLMVGLMLAGGVLLIKVIK